MVCHVDLHTSRIPTQREGRYTFEVAQEFVARIRLWPKGEVL